MKQVIISQNPAYIPNDLNNAACSHRNSKPKPLLSHDTLRQVGKRGHTEEHSESDVGAERRSIAPVGPVKAACLIAAGILPAWFGHGVGVLVVAGVLWAVL